jgi:hypothetical protein
MHHGTTQDLFDMLPPGDKGDFLHAYLYLKFLDQVIYQGVKASGDPCREPSGTIADEVIQDLLTGVIQEIGEGYFDPDTNVYHSKIVQLKDAIALVSQKENIKLSLSEKVVPFKLARDVILTNPESIAVARCGSQAKWRYSDHRSLFRRRRSVDRAAPGVARSGRRCVAVLD